MASIHPCKHANVMKKIIERMNASVIEAQRTSSAAAAGSPPKTKKSWGLPSVVKKSKKEAAVEKEEAAGADDQVEGLRVDQYLLVFMKLMSNITPTIELDSTAAI
jgi:ubiquitin-like-conjugating enzyme ATG3